MIKNQPFLTGFSTQICGSIRRRLQDVLAAKRRDLARNSITTYAMQFSHILPADFLRGLSASKRIRHYCNVVVFWAWIAQIFEANASLSKAVSLIQAWCDDAGLPVPNEDTSCYSRGRGRLSLSFLAAVSRRINDYLSARIQAADTYQGHIIKSIDGSSMSLDDTEKNQSQYPQPSSQKKGCGFPVMGIMGDGGQCASVDNSSCFCYASTMARSLRIEYPGAFYHVMARGNRRETIFLVDDDRRTFLKTLGEASERCGLRHEIGVRRILLHWLFRIGIGKDSINRNKSRIHIDIDGTHVPNEISNELVKAKQMIINAMRKSKDS